MHKKFIFLIATLISFFCCLHAYAQSSIQSIPNPKSRGNAHYVSDPDGHLSASTRTQLDAISAGIEKANGSEFAIVLVNDYQGGSDFDFALDLFTHWGIGKRGSNNGLLLFLGMDQRKYRFISGYGLEGIFPDALLKQIGESYLVPYLKAGNTDMAVLATARAIESVLLSPDHELELAGLQAYQPTFWKLHRSAVEQMLWVLAVFAIAFGWMSLARKRILKSHGVRQTRYKAHSFWYALFAFAFLSCPALLLFVVLRMQEQVYQVRNLPYFAAAFGALLLLFHYYTCRQYLKKSTKDVKTSLDMQASFVRMSLVPLLLSPLTYKAYYDLRKNREQARLRDTPPETAGKWSRVNRDELKHTDLQEHLSKLQMLEEKLATKSYEIWLDRETGNTRAVAHAGDQIARYAMCPTCHGQTLQNLKEKARKPPAKTRTRMHICAFCDYEKWLAMVALSKLQGGSASAAGFSGDGGSGGSSGGSFGGGSSGGGGAGGNW